MKRCNKCVLNVDSPAERCPLCYSILERSDGSPELPSYPVLLEQAAQYNVLWRILLFLSITAGSVCLTINWLTYQGFWWSFLIIANILYMWIAIGTAVRRHIRIGFNIIVQVVSLAALTVTFDYFLGDYGWALNYVVPLLFVTAMLSITIIIIVKRINIGAFILYFLLIALLGFIPIILRAAGFIAVLWPSLVSALYSAMSLVSIFIFADNATKIELKKRFRI